MMTPDDQMNSIWKDVYGHIKAKGSEWKEAFESYKAENIQLDPRLNWTCCLQLTKMIKGANNGS
jgi:hypothetical protein